MLFCGLEGKNSFLGMGDGRAGDPIAVSGTDGTANFPVQGEKGFLHVLSLRQRLPELATINTSTTSPPARGDTLKKIFC